MKPTEEEITRFQIECSCGCSELKFTQWKDDGISFISHVIHSFTAQQQGRFDRIKTAFKIFWNLAVLDKEYEMYEIVIDNNETLNRFKKFVSEMVEIKEIGED